MLGAESPTNGATATDRAEARRATPETVKSSVMRFFEGVDVDKPGIQSVGFVDIKITRWDNPMDGISPQVNASASIHGRKVASISRYFDPSLTNGVTERYALFGQAEFYRAIHDISVGVSYRRDETSEVYFSPWDADAVNAARSWVKPTAE